MLTDNLSETVEDFESFWFVISNVSAYFCNSEGNKRYLDAELRNIIKKLKLITNVEFWNFVFIEEMEETKENFEKEEDLYFNVLLKLADMMKRYKLHKEFIRTELVHSIAGSYLKSVRD